MKFPQGAIIRIFMPRVQAYSIIESLLRVMENTERFKITKVIREAQLKVLQAYIYDKKLHHTYIATLNFREINGETRVNLTIKTTKSAWRLFWNIMTLLFIFAPVALIIFSVIFFPHNLYSTILSIIPIFPTYIALALCSKKYSHAKSLSLIHI